MKDGAVLLYLVGSETVEANQLESFFQAAPPL
jgi:hypothetical protein